METINLNIRIFTMIAWWIGAVPLITEYLYKYNDIRIVTGILLVFWGSKILLPEMFNSNK